MHDQDVHSSDDDLQAILLTFAFNDRPSDAL